MKRLLRYALDAAAVLSLVLGVATAVFWVRGHFVGDVAGWAGGRSSAVYTPPNFPSLVLHHSDRAFLVASSRGGVAVGGWWGGSVVVERLGWFYNRSAPPQNLLEFPTPHDRFRVAAAGGQVVYRVRSTGLWELREFQLVLPCWLVCLLASVAPLLAWRRRRQAARARLEGARPCARCGYDLRATPGRCPECGAAATGREAK